MTTRRYATILFNDGSRLSIEFPQQAEDSSSASLPALPGLNEFFIVVPHRNGLSGGYGGRTPLPGACFPEGTVGTTCDAEN